MGVLSHEVFLSFFSSSFLSLFSVVLVSILHFYKNTQVDISNLTSSAFLFS